MLTGLLFDPSFVESGPGVFHPCAYVYMNPNTLTMMDMLEVTLTGDRVTRLTDNPYYWQVNTFKLMDCNKAHYDKEIVQ